MRILGIDRGSTSFKAVEVESSFGRYEIREYYEQRVEETPDGSGAQLALARLIQGLPKAPDRIAIALPTGQTTFRNLKLPTKDRKAIQAAIGFELDDELPFNIEDAVYDYVTLAQDKQGTQVHVAVTLKETINETLAFWQGPGVDPDVITTESAAYRAFLNRIIAPENQLQPIMVVRIGHRRTVIYIHMRGMPVLSREIAWGGRELTSTISQRFGVPLDQAERTKLDHGFVIPPSQRMEATPEQIEFSDALLAPIQKLIWNLRQAKITSKNITNENLAQIYVTGGTSILPGLAQVIEETVQAPVAPLQALSSIATTSGVTYAESADATFLNAAALAMSFVGPERSTLVTFRKGALAKRGTSRELNLSSLRRPMMAFGAVMTCLLISLVVQSSSYKQQLQQKNKELERAVKTFFPMISDSTVRTYLASLADLKKRVNTQIARQRELTRLMAPNPRFPLDVVKRMSVGVPRDLVVDLIQTQIGASPGTAFSPTETGDASLTFLVANAGAAERLKGLLTPYLTGIKMSAPADAPGKDPKSKRVKVTFTGKPTEAAYGE
ncbi:MAG TPA: type II secretion system protein GspL [Bdellovibrionota bacterium]|nr:type II secretion system protein GspL [Bdellovibrionota bacterium]